MNVHLTPEIEQLARSKISSGEYSSPSDVVCEALRLLGERDQLLALQKEDIARKIETGLASLRCGKGIDGEIVFDRIESELDRLERTGNK